MSDTDAGTSRRQRFQPMWALWALVGIGIIWAAVELMGAVRAAQHRNEPTPPSAGTPATTPGTAITPTPPAIPEAAKEHTDAGAQAFFTYFISVMDYSYRAQDTTVIHSISDLTCKYCLGIEDSVREARNKGVRYKGGSFIIESTKVEPQNPRLPGITTITAVVSQESSFAITTSSTRSIPPDKGMNYKFWTYWDHDKWLTYDARVD